MAPTSTRPYGRGTGRPEPVDVHVGRRVRLRRTLLGLSQEKLGAAVGLTFQQIQKYERGTNRIGASRLWQVAHALDVPVSFFFDDMPGAGADMAGAAAPRAPLDLDRELLETARDLQALTPATRTAVRRIIAATLAAQRQAAGHPLAAAGAP